MNAILTTAIIGACLFLAIWKGLWLRRFLPADHLSPDSKDSVKLAMGLVATMAALLLGLLVSSAKTSYDTTRTQVMQKAAKFALLDRLLAIYGPPAATARGELRSLIAESIRQTWPDGSAGPESSKFRVETGNAFYASLLKLEARDDSERALKAQVTSLALDIGQLYSLMQAESTTSISTPMLVVVVVWLVLIFVAFSVIAPPNATAQFSLVASAMCAAGAIFLILELDRPFEGLLHISSEPMQRVSAEIGK